MGTPNSAVSTKAIRAYVLYGTTPSVDMICALELDLPLFEDRYRSLKSQQPYIGGYRDLQSVRSDNLPGRTESWVTLVYEAGLTSDQAIRFEKPGRPSGEPILWLAPVDAGSEDRQSVEVFLLRTGEWLIWDGSRNPSSPPHGFTRHTTPNGVVTRLLQIAGDKYKFATDLYRHLYYTPISETSPEHRSAGNMEVSVALVLMQHLGSLLDASVAKTKSRVARQEVLLDQLDKVNGRCCGLNAPPKP